MENKIYYIVKNMIETIQEEEIVKETEKTFVTRWGHVIRKAYMCNDFATYYTSLEEAQQARIQKIKDAIRSAKGSIKYYEGVISHLEEVLNELTNKEEERKD